jgi:hypothetical protein
MFALVTPAVKMGVNYGYNKIRFPRRCWWVRRSGSASSSPP